MITRRYPKEVVLTDGRKLTLRPVEETDKEVGHGPGTWTEKA